MRLVIGLGPIGGNVGARLAELGHDVYGYDLSPDRVREWSKETQSAAGSDLAAVDWPSVDSVHIAVRLADQVSSVFESLQDHAAIIPIKRQVSVLRKQFLMRASDYIDLGPIHIETHLAGVGPPRGRDMMPGTVVHVDG